jgi:D-threonate/D-erythronate kinase
VSIPSASRAGEQDCHGGVGAPACYDASPVTLTVVADDLTGACDTGTVFAGLGAVPVTVWPSLPPSAPTRVVDTETRTRSAREAATCAAAAAQACPARYYFKKIDSTLRGRIGAEIDALLTATGLRCALFCPAFPGQGRRVVDRILTLDGTPVAETAIGSDPEFPRALGVGRTSSVVDLLRPQVERPLAWIPLDQVRAGPDALGARLKRLAGTVAIADAESNADLDALVVAALALEPAPLLVGAAGLAQSLATSLGIRARPPVLPGGRWLLVCGSQHPATRSQISAARAAGIRVLSTPEAEQPDRLVTATALARDARALLEREAFDLVGVTGGETAMALYSALDAERIDLLGAPEPGLAFGHLRRPVHAALPLLTKAGGFGEPGLFVTLKKGAVT